MNNAEFLLYVSWRVKHPNAMQKNLAQAKLAWLTPTIVGRPGNQTSTHVQYYLNRGNDFMQ